MKIVGMLGPGTLNWLREPISRKKISMMDRVMEMISCLGVILLRIHAATSSDPTKSASKGVAPSSGKMATAPAASHNRMPRRKLNDPSRV